jgi:hypothetical protein
MNIQDKELKRCHLSETSLQIAYVNIQKQVPLLGIEWDSSKFTQQTEAAIVQFKKLLASSEY